jgi:cation diffusion facilitator CzcD-associated flavoprotein CzcO
MADKSQLDYDVVIIGAGISGINAAYRVQTEAPKGTTYCILEGRDSLGGTWDLFRYPGIRSDSDVYTFGFSWSPWLRNASLGSGPQIKEYLVESAQKHGIDKAIRYRHHVTSADWSSTDHCWTLNIDVNSDSSASGEGDSDASTNTSIVLRARHIMLGTGYYNYEEPLQTTIPGIENFQGKVIHPQFWPEDYDYTGKEIVVVGSGATAVTLLPSLLDRAKRVTMLQRSPTYIFSIPSRSRITALLQALLPAMLVHHFNRINWIVKSYVMIWFCRTFPGAVKALVRRRTIRELPPQISVDPHFKPRYNPWEQRFCASMDGDFFAALRSGRADVVTDHIRTVTESAIELESGQVLHPDVIVTATGLKLRFGGGVRMTIDGGEPVNLASKFTWKTVMLQDLPNLFFMTGYENASWTLGADVAARLFVRMLGIMRSANATMVVPRVPEGVKMPSKGMMSLSSTYLKNAGEVLPHGGTGQWSPKKSYLHDMYGAAWGDISTDLQME